jgi:hypothetical protein
VALAALPKLEAVLSLWLSLSKTRNDIDHAGMREEPGEARNLVKSLSKCIADLDKLPLPEDSRR